MSYLVFDTETTGLPLRELQIRGWGTMYHPKKIKAYDPSRVVQISWIVYNKDGKSLKERDYIIKPDGFEVKNTRFHGITTEIANEKGVDFQKAIKKMKKDIKTHEVETLVAHNIEFDINVTLSEIYRRELKYKKIFKNLERADTMYMGQDVTKINTGYRNYKYPKLVELYEHIKAKTGKGLDEKITYHNSLSDVRVCGYCYEYISRTFRSGNDF